MSLKNFLSCPFLANKIFAAEVSSLALDIFKLFVFFLPPCAAAGIGTQVKVAVAQSVERPSKGPGSMQLY